MNYKADYNNHKQSVIDLLDLVIDFYNNYSDPEKLSALESIKSSVENGTFSITVIGQFSAGKSTFLNALMGEKYLPSYTSETTATINFLESVSKSPINKPCIRVLYRDKSEKILEDVCIENIEKYVSTRGSDVAKNVESVNLYLDSKFLNDGVCLVDSPGLNGIKEGHAEITNQQIDRSHAAIFMFNAKQPGTQTDFKILKKVIERCNSVFIVLNQIDQINTSEQSVESVIEDLRKDYRIVFPDAPIPEIHPLSSYLALVGRSSQNLLYHERKDYTNDEKKELIIKSQVPVFEDRLFKFLTHGEKTKQELLEPINKVNVFLTETRNTINESISMLEGSTDVSEVQQKISSLQDEINSLNKEIGNSKQTIRNNVSDILKDAENRIKSETREVREKYLQRIEEEDEIEELETNSELYIKNIQATYIDIISRIIDNANDEYYNLINEKYCEFTSKIEKKINDTSNNLFENNFQVSLDKSYFQLDIDLDDYIERRKELEESQVKKEKDIINVESELDEANINDEKRQWLEKEKSDAVAERNNDIAIMGNRPSVVHYNKVTYERNWGLGGVLKWIWNGNPAKPKTISATDSSDRDYWDKKMNDIQNSHSKRISDLQKQLESIPPTCKARLETKMKQLEREKERISEELINLEAEKNKQIADSKKKKVKSAKAYLQSYIQDMENNQLSSTYKMIKERKEDMIETLVAVVSEGISKNITRKTELLENNKKMMESSVEQKEESLKQLKDNNDKIEILLEKVNESKEQIDSIEIDEIKRD